jgi:hypothetical protein
MNDVKRPSLREAARRGANRQARPAAPPPPKPTPAPAKPTEAVKVTAACGHEIDVAPCKPAFQAERLKKLASLPCPECKRKAQTEREATEQEAARKRREEKEARTPRPKPRLGRLPHGSTFHVVYDAEAVRWSGTLTIPAPGSGIFKESVVSADDGECSPFCSGLTASFAAWKTRRPLNRRRQLRRHRYPETWPGREPHCGPGLLLRRVRRLRKSPLQIFATKG